VVGKVGCGKVGIEGKGGKVGNTGKVGVEGAVVCRRWRAAKLLLIMLEKLKTMKKAKMKELREGAITDQGNSQSREVLLGLDGGGNEGYHHGDYIGRWTSILHGLWLGKM
jgi:hypothetical protein